MSASYVCVKRLTFLLYDSLFWLIGNVVVGNEPVYRCIITKPSIRKGHCAAVIDREMNRKRGMEMNLWRAIESLRRVKYCHISSHFDRKSYAAGVLWCPFTRADYCDRGNWDPVGLCCAMNACFNACQTREYCLVKPGYWTSCKLSFSLQDWTGWAKQKLCGIVALLRPLGHLAKATFSNHNKNLKGSDWHEDNALNMTWWFIIRECC